MFLPSFAKYSAYTVYIIYKVARIALLVYTGCMIANHANQVILDNLVKQNGAFDVSTAYQAMKEQVSSQQY